jgi:hypothetical protein
MHHDKSHEVSDNKGANLTVHSELAKPWIKLHVVTLSCTALLQITSLQNNTSVIWDQRLQNLIMTQRL